ncbi:hypothetical protein [Natrialba taiwanensis]|uniref:DUF8070 domain-containing protein n=1 Tax=Natrialba taiwanensis DSM 12281 TaxID=1230458 RepID=L9ZRW1_9EURY|nr:hypothetical protein [Natrialba taiwanensis]ELY88302.1 hypothetical protein C484_15352 [Natrialba taiwanensis DSM 12281]
MDLTRLLKPLVMDTGVLGLLTVGLVYALTYSGPFILGLAALGVLLVALGGGAAAQAPAGGSGYNDDSGLHLMGDDMDIWPGSSPNLSVRVRLLFYGIGLVGWSLIVLGLFSSSLH